MNSGRERSGTKIGSQGSQTVLKIGSLARTPFTVAAIASDLGFQEASYFNRFFKRMAGATPREFRLRESPAFSAKSDLIGPRW